jgi:Uma2 family endonuclease
VVAHGKNLNRSPFPMDDVALAVEVVSPSSVLRDREFKRALYARAGVPAYWLVEPDEKSAALMRYQEA